jgi:hypothetical protein
MTYERLILAFTLVLFFAGCGTVASVQPLGKGKKALALSSGGPVKELFGIKMPIPYSVLRYRYGLNDNTDIHFGLHPTMMVMGNLSLEAGVTRQVLAQHGIWPALSVEVSIYSFLHILEFSTVKAFPAFSIVASNAFTGARHLVYYGVQSMFQYTEPYAAIAPVIGFELPLGRRLLLDLEARWYAPNEESEMRVVDYEINPFDHGAIGFVWGLSFTF